MKKSQKDERDKYLLSRDKHLRDLYERSRQTTKIIPLDPPVRNGWKKNLVLREDISKSPYAAIVGPLIQYVQQTWPCDAHGKVWWTKRVKDPSTRKWKDEIEEIVCKPKYIELRDWPEIEKKLTLKQKGYFSKEFVKMTSWYGDYFKEVMAFNTPWMMVEKVSPNYEYFRYERDEELERKIEVLERELRWNYTNSMRLDHLVGRRRRRDHREWNAFGRITVEKDDKLILTLDLEDFLAS